MRAVKVCHQRSMRRKVVARWRTSTASCGLGNFQGLAVLRAVEERLQAPGAWGEALVPGKAMFLVRPEDLQGREVFTLIIADGAAKVFTIPAPIDGAKHDLVAFKEIGMALPRRERTTLL